MNNANEFLIGDMDKSQDFIKDNYMYVPVGYAATIVKNNEIVDLISEQGVYTLSNYSSNEYKKFYINIKELIFGKFNSKIKLDKEYNYSPNITLKVVDPKKVMEKVGYKEITIEDYFNNYLKEDLENNLNQAISNVVNDKKISFQDIISDDLNNELEKLMSNSAERGIELRINIEKM